MFAYSVRFGPASILALYGVWALPLVFEPRLLLVRPAHLLVLGALAGLAVLSTLWSEAPATTLRTAIQYASTIVCAIIAARVLAVRTLALGGLVGATVVVLYSLAVGRYEYDVLDGTYALVGAFASKNQLGFFVSIAILLGGFLLAARSSGLIVKGAAAGAIALAGYALVASQSATSVISLAGVGAVSAVVWLVSRIPPNRRIVVLAGGVALIAVAAFAALQMGAFSGLLAIFGKDATLTGRTYLWSEGIAAAAENPWLGKGYAAFWVHGSAHAERLWEEFYIASRTGFHFHNTYIEAAVELGLVGLGLLVVLLALLIGLVLRQLLRARASLATLLPVAVVALLLVRSMVEIDVFTPYTVGTFLLYASFAILLAGPAAWPAKKSAPVLARRRAGAATA